MPAREALLKSVAKKIFRLDQAAILLARFIEFRRARFGPRIAQNQHLSVFIINIEDFPSIFPGLY